MMFDRMGVIADQFNIVDIGIFYLFGSCDLDLDPMTFLYELDQLIVRGDMPLDRANMKWTSIRQGKAFESYRLTDTQT